MQIKGNKQLIHLSSQVEFLKSKFDEVDKEVKEKDDLINSLRIEISSFKAEVKNLKRNLMIRSNIRVGIAC